MSIETRASLLLRLRAADDTVAWYDFVCIYEPVIYRIARSRGLQDADESIATAGTPPSSRSRSPFQQVANLLALIFLGIATRGRAPAPIVSDGIQTVPGRS